MPFQSQNIDAGSNPTIPVAVDLTGGAQYQRVKLANPTADQAGAWGTDADPLRVRSRRRGTSAYDSGVLTVPGSDTEVTSATVYVETVYLHNTSTSVVKVTLQNTAGVKYLNQVEMLPKGIMVLSLGGMSIVGIRWEADTASAVNGQIVGEQ